MIGWLRGQVVDNGTPGRLVMDVNGVGYDIETSMPTFFKAEIQENAIGLHIHTVVREDAILLYGFIDKHERSLFRSLIKVNGVGPKMAIAILSSITPDDFIRCIQQQNTDLLVRLPGIGKKTAERLVVEMKDSLTQIPQSLAPQKPSDQDEAIKALEALGYKAHEASKAMRSIEDANEKTCEQLIRQALQILASR